MEKNPKHSNADWATLIEKIILAILGFLTGSGISSAMTYLNF